MVSTLKDMKVLLVEGERKIARAIKLGLKQEHAVVDVVHDGDEGLSAALWDEYDVIILERMLPGGGDGVELCRSIRARDIQTPIIILTAKAQIKDKFVGLNAGADDYLTKPFSFEELLARVRAVLRRPQDNNGSLLQVADLKLDTTSSIATRRGKTINLSNTEYALLEYLMRNYGRVLSKANIIDHVWDFDADVLPNTVEAYIGYLRNKIDKPFGGPALIRTVRGLGYMIEAYEEQPG